MRNFHGITRAVIVIGLIINLLFSCSKDDEPHQYNVEIQNNYFERIESVHLGDIHFGNIENNSISESKEIEAGLQSFTANSKSGLLFRSKVDLKGQSYRVVLIFNEHGKLTIK